MKRYKILLVSIDPLANSNLKSELSDYFNLDCDIEGILVSELNSIDKLSGDIIVCTGKTLLDYISAKNPDNIPVVITKRVIRMGNMLEILSIKRGSNVSVVSNVMEEAKIDIKLLQDLGISHVNLQPYVIGSRMKSCSTAITAGEILKPNDAENVIFIGDKYLSFSTIHEIFFTLKLPIGRMDLITKCHRHKISKFKNYSRSINEIIVSMYNSVHEGLALIDENKHIVLCNEKFTSLLSLKHNTVIHKNYKKVLKDDKLISLLNSREERYDEVIRYLDKRLMLNLKKLVISGGDDFFVVTIQDVTHIQELENIIRKEILTSGFNAKYTFENVIGKSESIQRCIRRARRMAENDYNVLLLGSAGTGKEIFAQSIHDSSSRRDRSFVAVNLASLSDELAISELFGYEEGAFTGAVKGGKKGLFEIAHKGTIFLDEIGDASPLVQLRLLRVLQEREVMPIGGRKVIPIDIRIISATNRDLYQLMKEGAFREDLYYRLDVLSLKLPSLRERKEDIKPLINHYLEQYSIDKLISNEVLDLLYNYSWPGNVRELNNFIHYIDAVSDNKIVTFEDIPDRFFKDSKTNHIEEFEVIKGVLKMKGQLDEFKAILMVLDAVRKSSTAIGRNRIKGILEDRGIYLTEAQVKSRLTVLGEFGLIQQGKTKQGTKINSKGREFIKNC